MVDTLSNKLSRHIKMLVYTAIFIGGGFFGWAIDTASRSYNAGYFAPGTLIPFFSLIFAWAAVLLFALFRLVVFPFWLSVFLGGLICVGLELLCGMVSYTVFNYRFWDYSTKRFNFYGFIDVCHSVYWFILTFFYRFGTNKWVKKRKL